eukprot:TRINITY_DN14981_c0_g1_i1.p1 TRINITY_DN14981_c0_g1~~TRINITY_DN14981_c0_g1_i1.p1  ORF type:complete len:740 (-),score=55.51 TRINITY_DN14981_c0_g1_i1:103-2322(-)
MARRPNTASVALASPCVADRGKVRSSSGVGPNGVDASGADDGASSKRVKELLDKVVYYRAKSSALSDENKRLNSQVRANGLLQGHMQNEELKYLRSKCINLERTMAMMRRQGSMTGLLPVSEHAATPSCISPRELRDQTAQHSDSAVDVGKIAADTESNAPVPKLTLATEDNASTSSPRRARHHDGMLSARSTTGSACGSARVCKQGRLSGCSAILLSPRKSPRDGSPESPACESLYNSVDRLAKRVALLLEISGDAGSVHKCTSEIALDTTQERGVPISPHFPRKLDPTSIDHTIGTPLSMDSFHGSVSSNENVPRQSVLADLTEISESIQNRELLLEQYIERADSAAKALRERDELLNKKNDEIAELRTRLNSLEQDLEIERNTSKSLREQVQRHEQDHDRPALKDVRCSREKATSFVSAMTERARAPASSARLPLRPFLRPSTVITMPSSTAVKGTLLRARSGSPSPRSTNCVRGVSVPGSEHFACFADSASFVEDPVLTAAGGTSMDGTAVSSHGTFFRNPSSLMRAHSQPAVLSPSVLCQKHCRREASNVRTEPQSSAMHSARSLGQQSRSTSPSTQSFCRASPAPRYRTPSPRGFVQRQETDRLVKLRDDPPETHDNCTVFRSHWRLLRSPSAPAYAVEQSGPPPTSPTMSARQTAGGPSLPATSALLAAPRLLVAPTLPHCASSASTALVGPRSPSVVSPLQSPQVVPSTVGQSHSSVPVMEHEAEWGAGAH